MASRRDDGSARALVEGVYEHLVTEQLARELEHARPLTAEVALASSAGDS